MADRQSMQRDVYGTASRQTLMGDINPSQYQTQYQRPPIVAQQSQESMIGSQYDDIQLSKEEMERRQMQIKKEQESDNRRMRDQQFKERQDAFYTKLKEAKNTEQTIQLLTSWHKLAPIDPLIDSSKANNFLEKPDKLCGDKIDGQQCLELLETCLNSPKKECVEEFNRKDWSKEIDVKTMNYYAARRLAEHIGFYNKTVDDAIKDLQLNNQLSEPLIAVFEAIKLRINQEEKQPINKFEVKHEVKKVPSMMVRRATPIYGFEVQDGGGLTSYNNLIMNLDILKTNLLMNGGGCNTSILIRSSLNTLVQLLKEQGKQIDDTDLETIHRYIFNLEKNEKKLKELREYIHILIEAISNDNYKVTNPVTLQTLEEFAKKEKTIDHNIQIKIEGLHDLFNIIVRTINKKQDGM
jgi:hypothetical protein